MRPTFLLSTKESVLGAEIRVLESRLNLALYPSKSFQLWSPCFFVELIKDTVRKTDRSPFLPIIT